MSIYTDFQKLASGLLSKFDQGGMTLDVFAQSGGSAWDATTTTYTAKPFQGVATTVNPLEYRDDSTVLSTDIVVTMPHTLTPKAQDRVTIAGVQHSIVKIIRTPAAGDVVVWKVVVRK